MTSLERDPGAGFFIEACPPVDPLKDEGRTEIGAEVVIGLDPHKDVLVVVGVDRIGGRVRFLLAEDEGFATAGAAGLRPDVGRPHRRRDRFKSATAFAMFTSCAPMPASSGNSQRVRLNRGGNRLMNPAIHRIAITQKSMHPSAQEHLATRRALGTSNTEANRALKRHLARRVLALLRAREVAAIRVLPTEKPTAAYSLRSVRALK